MLCKNNDKNFLIGGVDEAGRGSILGPLVVAGMSIKKSKLRTLRQIGVKDSKLLTPKAREKLFMQVCTLAESICVCKIDCAVVDDNVFLKRLNKLEADIMAFIINNIHVDEVYIDSCDINPCRYGQYIMTNLIPTPPQLYCMHHADRLNTAVAAASIIAKVTRDREINKIRKTYSDIGSGYPCDRHTMQFIKGWVVKYKCAPEFARRSWSPLRHLLEGLTSVEQSVLIR